MYSIVSISFAFFYFNTFKTTVLKTQCEICKDGHLLLRDKMYINPQLFICIYELNFLISKKIFLEQYQLFKKNKLIKYVFLYKLDYFLTYSTN